MASWRSSEKPSGQIGDVRCPEHDRDRKTLRFHGAQTTPGVSALGAVRLSFTSEIVSSTSR